MLIKPRLLDDINILALVGEFASDEDATLLRIYIDTQLSFDTKKIVLDLESCTDISSIGLETIAWAYTKMKTRKAELKLFRASVRVLKSLKPLSVDIEIYYDEVVLATSYVISGPFIDKPDP